MSFSVKLTPDDLSAMYLDCSLNGSLPIAVPFLNVDILILLGSVWLSVQNNRSSMILTPVIKYLELKFSILLISTNIGCITSVVLSYSTIALALVIVLLASLVNE